MARGKASSEGTGKIKFRVVEFEMDGTDASLEDGLKAIAAALNRAGGGGHSPTRLVHKANGAGEPVPAGAESDVNAEEESAQEEEEQQEPRVTRAPAKPKKVVPRKVVNDFRLDDVTPTLKDYAESKGPPPTDLGKYLVIAAWAKEHKQMEELSPDHFYTAYKHMDWDVPKDPVQPIRDLLHHRRGKFSKPTNAGYGRINHLGENDVAKMVKK